TLASAAAYRSRPTVAAQTATPSYSSLIQQRPGVSDSFATEIKEALASIPSKYIAALERGGYKLVLSRRLTDVVPAARNQQVRGYEASATWNSVYGMFNRTTKRVVMAELAERSQFGKNELVPLKAPDRR